MSLGSKIIRNTTFLTVGDKLGYLFQYVFFLFFARRFGVIPTGEYSFAYTFTYIFIVIADLGISVYLIREVARNRSSDRQLVFDCLLLRLISITLVVFLATGVLAIISGGMSPEKIMVIGCWGVYWIAFGLADVFLAELKGHERMGHVALLGVSLKLLITVIGISLILLKFNYVVVLIALPISSLVYLLASVTVSSRFFGRLQGSLQSFSHYTQLIRALLPFFFTIILVEILYSQDILILGILKNDRSVGIYSTAIKIVTFILGISIFFHTALLPVFSKLYIESREKLIDVSSRLLRYIILISLPISFGLASIANRVVDLLYSDLFAESGIVLVITSWTITIGLIHAVFSVLLTAIDRQKEKVIFIGINFVISTILNVTLIQRFDYIGAAGVKIATALIGLLLFIYLVSKYLDSLPFLKSMMRPVLASIVMVSFIMVFDHWSLLVVIPLSGFIYILFLTILGSFTRDEVQFVKSFLMKKVFRAH